MGNRRPARFAGAHRLVGDGESANSTKAMGKSFGDSKEARTPNLAGPVPERGAGDKDLAFGNRTGPEVKSKPRDGSPWAFPSVIITNATLFRVRKHRLLRLMRNATRCGFPRNSSGFG